MELLKTLIKGKLTQLASESNNLTSQTSSSIVSQLITSLALELLVSVLYSE